MNQALINPQDVLKYMQDLQLQLKQSGRLKGAATFGLSGLAARFQVQEQQMHEMLTNLSASGRVHQLSRGNWALGKNEWEGQVRKKIFHCQHCGKLNEVDITE